MSKFKQLVKKYLTHFSYFYIHLRHKLFIALGLSMAVGVLDGFGLAMFLPLLQMVDESSNATAEGLGNLRFLIDIMENLGINLTVSSVLLVILFFFTLKGVAKFFESYYKVLVQQYFIKKIRFDTISKLSSYSYKAFVTADVGRIQNTLSGEVGRVAQAYQTYFAAVQAGVLVLVYVVLAFLSNPQFAILVAIGGFLSNLIYKQIYKKTKETSRKITNIGHEFQSLLIQKVAFYKYLKATGLIRNYATKLLDTVKRIESNNRKIGFYNSILAATREPLVMLVVVVVIIIQVTYVAQSLGLIILSLLFFYRSLTYLMSLQTQWNQFLNVSGSLENMTAFVSELSASQEIVGTQEFNKFSRAIELKNINFYYGNSRILKNINLNIPRNISIALVGESGSGKTSLVNILSGLMPVEQGEMLIDGTSSKNIDITSFQYRIGYITQEPVIFTDSVYNNITFWASKTPENITRFWEALRKAAIEDFVLSLPEKENAILGNNGALVSGGQKQRLSIARELFKDIDILIMDEATSALDSETERAIQENINSLKGHYTIIIVAHRLSTIKDVDLIVLLNKGEIRGIGNYEYLINSSEKFKKMTAIQEV